jgi:hypothetical protein
MKRDVRYWHKADIPIVRINVRPWGSSGHAFVHRICLLLTQSGHELDDQGCTFLKVASLTGMPKHGSYSILAAPSFAC